MSKQILSLICLALAFTAPSMLAAEKSPDWPAFHRGGALTGEADAASDPGPPPMKTRWTYRTNEDDPAGILGSAAIVGDTVYVADVDGVLHAVDLKTGTARWTYKTGDAGDAGNAGDAGAAGEAGDGFETTPLVAHGRVFIGDLAGVFHAVNVADGKRAWAVETLSAIHSSANLHEGSVVFGNDGAEIYCVDAKTGDVRWKKSAGDRVNSAPAIASGAALVSGCDAILRAIDVATGDERFTADLGALSPGSPAVLDKQGGQGGIIIGTDQGRVVCLAADGSETLWEYTEIQSDAMVYASPAVSEGIAVVGARDRHVHAMDAATGKPLWKFRTRGDVDSSPAIAAGKVYVGSKDKRLYVLDLKSGKELWSFNAGKAITASPAVAGGAAGGVVVIGDGGGTLYCLEAEKP